MTGQHESLNAALAAVQAELPAVEKTRTAEVRTKDGGSYTYRYADLADVSAAIMPLLGKHGLAFTCRPTLGGEQFGFGVAYALVHESGGEIAGWYPIQQGSPQQTGGLITYARRYALCAVTGIAAEEDVDARDAATPVRARTPRQQPEQAQRTAQRRTQTPAARPGITHDPVSAAVPQVTNLPPLPGELDQDDSTYDTPGTVTRPQLTKLAVLMGGLGYTPSERDQRLHLASRITGRQLETSNDLSRNEASKLIDAIDNADGDFAALEELLTAEGR
jgi:ERF superfamily